MFDMFGKEGQTATRRLPVYLLLDTSGSMAGEAIEGVRDGVQLLHNELMNNPQALDTVHIAVITFASDAQMVTPLTDLLHFTPPPLDADGATALGAALTRLNQSLDTDIIANSTVQKGDYRPLVFLLSDGDPTDAWQKPLEAVRGRAKNRIGTLIALACGKSANTNVLKEVADVVLVMNSVTSDALQAYFRWVSASVSTASVAAAKGGETGHAQAPQLPVEAGVQVL
jgi:uncharacterized protein YegL